MSWKGSPKNKGLKMILNNNLPITLYDVNNKNVVGIFISKTHCSKYVFAGLHNSTKMSTICNSLRQKSRFKSNGFLYTIRTANEQQCLILGDQEYIILNGYAAPKNYNMNKF